MTGPKRAPGFTRRPADPEAWIRSAEPSSAAPRSDGFTARLTIDVTADQRGVTVADMLRELFAREFPETSGDRS